MLCLLSHCIVFGVVRVCRLVRSPDLQGGLAKGGISSFAALSLVVTFVLLGRAFRMRFGLGISTMPPLLFSRILAVISM